MCADVIVSRRNSDAPNLFKKHSKVGSDLENLVDEFIYKDT